MNADFLDAQTRHWEDAEALFNARRLANADHLYGFSAECGLKALMSKFDMPAKADGTPTEKQDRVHIDKVWSRYETYRSGHGVSGYDLPSPPPFDDWKEGQRYANRAEFDETRVTGHRNGAEQVRSLIEKARRDGLI